MRLPAGFLGAGAFVSGVALAGSGVILPILVALLGTVLVVWIWTEDRRHFLYGSLLILLVAAGALRTAGDDGYPSAPVALSTSESFSGRVLDVPSHYPASTHVRIDLEHPEEARVWGVFPPYPSVTQGDLVEATGRFLPNDETSFRGFSAQRDTAGVLEVHNHGVIGNDTTSAQRTRTRLASEISERLTMRIPEPAGAFATGVILGDDGAMTEATRHSFRVGGLTHMTAVSGVHVGIIAAAILLVSQLGFVNRWWMLGMSIPFIWSFAYLVGMRPSVVRASLMLTLLVVANLLGRPRDTLNAVGLAAAAMLIVQPSFRHDIGFQLSVAATTGIALGVLLLGRRSHWHLIWVVPISAQLATEPLILYHFGYYSIVSPLANILAAPFLAMTMALSILTVLTSLVSGLLADAMALATWVPAYAVVLIADYAASIPYLSDDVPQIGLTSVWMLYAVLGGLVVILFAFLDIEINEGEGEFSVLYRV